MLQTRAITSVALCEAMLEHIRRENGRIRAVRTPFDARARADAAEVDHLRAQGQPMGALAGIPFLVKENIDVLPGPVSAGLEFLASRVPDQDAWIVKKLRSAGAIVLGTTVSDPGAFGVRTEYVKHPKNPALTVGGSSGGSAAALAAGFAFAALGTDTGGSIRIPSACCGTAGLKPTMGAWRNDGVHPLVRDLDHVGPMARTVADLAIVWNALATGGAPQQPANGAISLRVGWCPEWLAWAQPDVQREFERTLRQLAQEGCQLIPIRLPRLEDVIHVHVTHFCHEACKLHLEEFGYAPDMFPAEAQEAFRAGRSLSREELDRAEAIRRGLRSQVDEALDNVDILVVPTLPVHQPEVKAESFQIGGRSLGFTLSLVLFTSLFNHTGHPVLATPAPGAATDSFHGVQWVGRWGTERSLLEAVGRLLEQAI